MNFHGMAACQQSGWIWKSNARAWCFPSADTQWRLGRLGRRCWRISWTHMMSFVKWRKRRRLVGGWSDWWADCRAKSGPKWTSGWWFGTFFIFPYIGNNHPNWLIFFRGVQTTNQTLSELYPELSRTQIDVAFCSQHVSMLTAQHFFLRCQEVVTPRPLAPGMLTQVPW